MERDARRLIVPVISALSAASAVISVLLREEITTEAAESAEIIRSVGLSLLRNLIFFIPLGG